MSSSRYRSSSLWEFEGCLENFQFIQSAANPQNHKDNILSSFSLVFLEVSFVDEDYRSFTLPACLPSQRERNMDRSTGMCSWLSCSTLSCNSNIDYNPDEDLCWNWNSTKYSYPVKFSTQMPETLVKKFLNIRAFKQRYKGWWEPLLLGVYAIDVYSVASGPIQYKVRLSSTEQYYLQFSCTCTEFIPSCNLFLEQILVYSMNQLSPEPKLNSKTSASTELDLNECVCDLYYVDDFDNTMVMAEKIPFKQLASRELIMKQGLIDLFITRLSVERFCYSGILLFLYQPQKNNLNWRLVAGTMIPLVSLWKPHFFLSNENIDDQWQQHQFRKSGNTSTKFIHPLWTFNPENQMHGVQLGQRNHVLEVSLSLSNTPSFFQMTDSSAECDETGVSSGQFMLDFPLPFHLSPNAVLLPRNLHPIYQSLCKKFNGFITNNSSYELESKYARLHESQLVDWINTKQNIQLFTQTNADNHRRPEKFELSRNPFTLQNKLWLLQQAYQEKFQQLHEQQQLQIENHFHETSKEPKQPVIFYLAVLDTLHVRHLQEYQQLTREYEEAALQLQLANGELLVPSFTLIEQ